MRLNVVRRRSWQLQVCEQAGTKTMTKLVDDQCVKPPEQALCEALRTYNVFHQCNMCWEELQMRQVASFTV